MGQENCDGALLKRHDSTQDTLQVVVFTPARVPHVDDEVVVSDHFADDIVPARFDAEGQIQFARS